MKIWKDVVEMQVYVVETRVRDDGKGRGDNRERKGDELDELEK